jgi:hypothetical protein
MWQQQALAKRKAAAAARNLARQLSNQDDVARVLAYADQLDAMADALEQTAARQQIVHQQQQAQQQTDKDRKKD